MKPALALFTDEDQYIWKQVDGHPLPHPYLLAMAAQELQAIAMQGLGEVRKQPQIAMPDEKTNGFGKIRH